MLILVAGFALWRLAQGPVALNRLTPYVAAALDRTFPGLDFRLGGFGFGFDRGRRELDLWAEGVRVSRSDGEALADFPQVVASVSLAALLRGKLSPTRLVVDRPVLRFVRTEQGRIKFRFGDYPSLGAALLDQSSLPQAPNAPLGALRLVAVRDARLVLDDKEAGHRWRADRVDATIERGAGGFDGDLAFAVPIGAARPEFHARYRYREARDSLDIALDFGEFAPRALAGMMPQLAPLAALGSTVSGRVEARLDLARLEPQSMRLDLNFGPGGLDSALFAAGGLALAGGALHAAYLPERHELRLERLNLDLGQGAEIGASGWLDGITPEEIAGKAPLPASLKGAFSVRLAGLPIAEIDALWPRPLAPGGRRWVRANISTGVLDEAALEFNLGLDPTAPSAAVAGAHGTMRYHGLSVTCLKGLPPVREFAGTGRLQGQQLDFTPTDGSLEGLRVSGGSVSITRLDEPVQRLAVDVAVAGPVADALRLVARPPFDYAKAIGIDPAEFGGAMTSRLRLKLPLLQGLRLGDVDFALTGQLSAVRIGGLAFGRALEDGRFTVAVGRPGARLEGAAQVAGIPAKIDAVVSFGDKARPRARYHAALTLDAAARQRLFGGALPGRIDGPAMLDVTYSQFDGGRAEGAALFDLRQAAVAFREAGWKKPAGMPGTARLAFNMAGGQFVGPLQVALAAAGLDGRLAVGLGPEGQLERVDIARLAIGGSDVEGSVARLAKGGWQVDLEGAALDLGAALGRKDQATLPGLRIDAKLGRVIFGPGRRLDQVAAKLTHEGGEWREAQVAARFPNAHRLTLTLTDGAKRRFEFRSEDLGATLGLLDITDNVVGGKVTVEGRVVESAGKTTIGGQIDGSDYRLMRAPPLAQILALASLDAFNGMLVGSGIPFGSLKGRFSYGDGRLTLDDLVASGSAIGATATGYVDLARDRLDVQGTIVPAYMLNSIIGNVPVLGSLLLGGEGQGLIAANYQLAGPIATPQVSVDPLSALTPGFMRRFLQPNFGVGRPPASDQ
ncbi:MAG TPA: AsmA-like C-terminal domain-containing protein [Stellaceae bacterium]|nr:AsmA-like C-terminal domain-containing protein [Stellaceae bacterium]